MNPQFSGDWLIHISKDEPKGYKSCRNDVFSKSTAYHIHHAWESPIISWLNYGTSIVWWFGQRIHWNLFVAGCAASGCMHGLPPNICGWAPIFCSTKYHLQPGKTLSIWHFDSSLEFEYYPHLLVKAFETLQISPLHAKLIWIMYQQLLKQNIFPIPEVAPSLQCHDFGIFATRDSHTWTL